MSYIRPSISLTYKTLSRIWAQQSANKFNLKLLSALDFTQLDTDIFCDQAELWSGSHVPHLPHGSAKSTIDMIITITELNNYHSCVTYKPYLSQEKLSSNFETWSMWKVGPRLNLKPTTIFILELNFQWNVWRIIDNFCTDHCCLEQSSWNAANKHQHMTSTSAMIIRYIHWHCICVRCPAYNILSVRFCNTCKKKSSNSWQ